jgi:prophage regulatory protein
MSEQAIKRFLRLPQVEDRTGLKHSQIHTLEVSGRFPKRVKISERASGWLEHEIDAWIEQRVMASRG